MANFSDEKVKDVWEKASTIENMDSKIWRKDVCGAFINRNAYGQESDFGWEIDHVLPTSKGGTDRVENLRPMHWKNNRSKADDYPKYKSVITSENNKNIAKETEYTVSEQLQAKLKDLYPNNSPVK